MFTGNIVGLKYVAVEVIPKNSAKIGEVECGAYMGIVKQKDLNGEEVQFLALLTAETTIRMYNLDEFNVLAIDALDKEMKYLTVFTNEVTDQEEAYNILKAVTKTMTKEGRLFANDPEKELINVDSYKDMPKAVLLANNLSDNKVGTGTNNNSFNNHTKTGGTTGTTNYGTTYTPPPKPTVLSFRRKGKLPSVEKLERVRELVMGISSGDILPRVLPTPKSEQKESVSDKTEGDTLPQERQTCKDMVG